MTGIDIYKAIYFWVSEVSGPEVFVVRAFQNAPQGPLPQIAIGMPIAHPVGFASKTNPKLAGGVWVQDLINDYEGNITLWQTGGQGEYLQALVDSLEADIWLEYFSKLGIAVDVGQDIQWLPRLNDKSYIQETFMQCNVRFTGSSSQNLTTINKSVVTSTLQGVT